MSWALCFPHLRGWSQPPCAACLLVFLLPAPAGMAPTPSLGRCRTAAAPRTRRDGPWAMICAAPSSSCSLHLRGWPRHHAGVRRHARLLPAPAGMAPHQAERRSHPLPAPRTCGDGPVISEVALIDVNCSPHPRGWSQRCGRPGCGPPLLPAPVGMVPSARHGGVGRPPVPRIRGDGLVKAVCAMSNGGCFPDPRGSGPGPGLVVHRCRFAVWLGGVACTDGSSGARWAVSVEGWSGMVGGSSGRVGLFGGGGGVSGWGGVVGCAAPFFGLVFSTGGRT
ncbi:hypothetical protein RKD44_007783 [Streptomyces collinus]